MTAPPITTYNLKLFLKYFFLDPWTSKINIFSLKNFITTFLIAGIVAIAFPLSPIIPISLILISEILSIIYEWKSGSFIAWNREQDYRRLNKVKKELKIISQTETNGNN